MDRIVFYTATQEKISSARCRGFDIAEALNMPININPTQVTKNDLVICIKCHVPEAIKKAGYSLIDIVDGDYIGLYNLINKTDNCGVLVMTPQAAEYAKKTWFPEKRVEFVPHSHCNNEGLTRPDRPVKTILYNGYIHGLQLDVAELSDALKKEGMELITEHTVGIPNQGRQRAVNSFMKADICIAFRKEAKRPELPLEMKGPTKLNNAGSFKIPSVAYPEPAFKNNIYFTGIFHSAIDIYHVIEGCIKLKTDKEYYDFIARSAYKQSKLFHINYIVKNYNLLLCRVSDNGK